MEQLRNYRIAEVNFSMSCSGSYTFEMCRDYETDPEESVEFHLRVSSKEIDRERRLAEEKFSDAYLESLALYRQLCEKMLDYDTFLFHCSAVAMDGKGYLFAAPSGTGKSTHTRLWREYFGEKAVMINDDKPLLQVRREAIYVCGTPWNGKHQLDTNQKVPVEGICILRRGRENVIEKISPMKAYPDLYRQTYRPGDREKMKKTLALLKQLAERIPLYEMHCTISHEAAELSWNTMSHGKK